MDYLDLLQWPATRWWGCSSSSRRLISAVSIKMNEEEA
jgi:hypothetical protein